MTEAARATALSLAFLATAPVVAAAAPPIAAADEPACTLPKGTRVSIIPAVPISSSQSRTGEIFGFSLAHDVKAPGCFVSATGAKGTGTVFLAGASGSAGHEGDLTLRLDTIRTFDDRYVVFDDQRMRINGKNRKIESAVLGFVPFAGAAAGLIRGSDVHLDDKTAIDTVLDRPATFTDVAPTFAPETRATEAPGAGPAPTATALLEPEPASYLLVVTGTTDPLKIDPAFTYSGPGEESPNSGAGTFSGYDASGRLLFNRQFDVSARTYGVSIPLTSSAYANLHSLTLTSGGKSVTVTSAASGDPVASATRTSANGVTFAWNSAYYPAVDCKGATSEKFMNPANPSPSTSVSFQTADSALQCTFSDGVRSTTIPVPVR